jgi:hypothetical protein
MGALKKQSPARGRASAPLQGGGHDRLHQVWFQAQSQKGNASSYLMPLRKATLIFAFALAACTTTPRGSFCEIAEPIRPANVDVLTDAEVTQLLAHNLKGQKLCNWKPKP